MLVVVLFLLFSFSLDMSVELEYSKQVAQIKEETSDLGNNMENLYQTVRFLVDRNNELESRMMRLEKQYLTDVKKLKDDFHARLRKEENRIVVLEKGLHEQTELVMKLKKEKKLKSKENGQPNMEGKDVFATEKRKTEKQHSSTTFKTNIKLI
jgi:predicted RNase H-like nuclease (RuvC/YqgF family)